MTALNNKISETVAPACGKTKSILASGFEAAFPTSRQKCVIVVVLTRYHQW
jgi:hypothetical protein